MSSPVKIVLSSKTRHFLRNCSHFWQIFIEALQQTKSWNQIRITYCTIQSTLALRTPRYYGQNLLVHASTQLCKMCLFLPDSHYLTAIFIKPCSCGLLLLQTPNYVPRVFAIMRVDCILCTKQGNNDIFLIHHEVLNIDLASFRAI